MYQKGAYKMKLWKKAVVIPSILALFASVAAFQATGYCEDQNKQIVAELQQIKNPAKPINIKFVSVDKADPKKVVDTVKVGDTVNFGFVADQDCYVYILDIGTSGKAHILFPNKWQTGNKAEKGKVYLLPPEGSNVVFRAQGPEGKNFVKAIATLTPQQTLPKTESKADEPFAEITNPSTQFKDLAAELEKTNEKNWAEAELMINVVKPDQPAK